jgi:BA14K-like protein
MHRRKRKRHASRIRFDADPYLPQGDPRDERSNMSNCVRRFVATVILAASISPLPGVAAAMPLSGALAIKNAAPAVVDTVQWRRGWGWGVGAGLVAGAIIGSTLASPYYGYGPYPYYGPYYAPGPAYYGPPAAVYGPPAPGYGAPVAGDAVAYCMQRFRSYDPRSGTYLGYDGVRHPCP